MNVLEMAEQKAIEALVDRGWSLRRIARELGIHRETVARYARQRRVRLQVAAEDPSKPAISTAGSSPVGPISDGAANEPVEPALAAAPALAPGRQSLCRALRQVITDKLEQGLSAQRIWQDLRGDHGFAGSYESVKRFVRQLGQVTPLPFRRMECAPGEEAQVDFGKGAPIIRPDGSHRRPHVFRIVLSHSRKGYCEVVFHQNTEQFIRCIENAFWHFGGVPKTLVPDNLKAAVLKADWFDPELNPKLQSFCEHYGVVLMPTKPYTPRHKGKIERGIGYVQDNALKGRTFSTLDEQNQFLTEWERSVADTRIHGTTRRQVSQLFTDVERVALRPLPAERFPFFYEAERCVNRDAHVEVDRAYYSVPPEHVGARVWVRWDARTVRVFSRNWQQVAMHVKRERGQFATDPSHIASEKISNVERGAVWLMGRVQRRIGPHAQRWAEAMLPVRGLQGVRVLQGLVHLSDRQEASAIERACEIALTHSAFHLRVIRALIKREGPKQNRFEFTTEHPIIRKLSSYDVLVRGAFKKETGT